MIEKISSMEAAYKALLKRFRVYNVQTLGVFPINSGRYLIAKTTRGNFLIAFKRDVFRNFGKQFGLTGVGDTFNVAHLKMAIQSGVEKIYSIFPNGYCYSIEMQKFLENSHDWINKEGTEVRSVSIHLYEKEFEL